MTPKIKRAILNTERIEVINFNRGGNGVISTLDKSAISLFLTTCKKEIKKGNCHFINRNLIIRGKTVTSKQALLDLGIMNKKQI